MGNERKVQENLLPEKRKNEKHCFQETAITNNLTVKLQHGQIWTILPGQLLYSYSSSGQNHDRILGIKRAEAVFYPSDRTGNKKTGVRAS